MITIIIIIKTVRYNSHGGQRVQGGKGSWGDAGDSVVIQ